MSGTLDLRPILPAAIVALTGLVVLLAQAFTPKGRRAPSMALSLAGLLGALAAFLVGLLAIRLTALMVVQRHFWKFSLLLPFCLSDFWPSPPCRAVQSEAIPRPSAPPRP